MKKHGGARKGAGRPKKDSPLGHFRVLENIRTGEEEASRAAERLGDLRWTRQERQVFRRVSGSDYIEVRGQVLARLWEALLEGLPKMAERGDVDQAWFAYRMITRKRYGRVRPPPDVLARLRELFPQAARALWRVSLVDDPKGLYKSTELLRIRRWARVALCRGIGIPITRQLIQVQGREFTGHLLTAIAGVSPTLTPKQVMVLAARVDDQRRSQFLEIVIKAGIFRIQK